MSIPMESITVKLGDTVIIPMQVSGPDGLPLDLTSAVLNFRIWEEGEEADAAGPFALTITDPDTGMVDIPLGPAQLSGLNARGLKYWYDIQIVNGATILQGRFYIEPDRVR